MSSSPTMQHNMIKNYLTQQMDNVFLDKILSPDNIQIHHSVNNHKQYNNTSDQTNESNNKEELLEEFKEHVKYWMTLDNEVKDINKKIKLLDAERKRRKMIIETLTPKITSYMQKNDIEELNSKDGSLKYRQAYVKKPLTQKQIKDQLYNQFGGVEKHVEMLNNIFQNRSKIKKESLKRLTY